MFFSQKVNIKKQPNLSLFKIFISNEPSILKKLLLIRLINFDSSLRKNTLLPVYKEILLIRLINFNSSLRNNTLLPVYKEILLIRLINFNSSLRNNTLLPVYKEIIHFFQFIRKCYTSSSL